MEKSYTEAKKIMELMDIDDIPVYRDASDQINEKENFLVSEGSEFIISEAMKNDDTPLYIALLGTLTDIAVVYLAEPEIDERITAAIWIGGGNSPDSLSAWGVLVYRRSSDHSCALGK